MTSPVTAHDWFVDNRVAFVARALDASESQTFADHLPRCAECQTAVTELERDLGWLPMGVQPVRPRPGLRRAIARSVLGEERAHRRPWLVPVALIAMAASLLIAAIATFAGYLPAQREVTRLAGALGARNQQIAFLMDTLSIMRQSSRVLQASIARDGGQGGLLIFADERSHRWNVVMHGLPPAPQGKSYQFWFICADGMVRSVSITGDPSRPAFVTLEMPPTGGAVMGAALTIEASNDRSGAPRGKELAHIML